MKDLVKSFMEASYPMVHNTLVHKGISVFQRKICFARLHIKGFLTLTMALL